MCLFGLFFRARERSRRSRSRSRSRALSAFFDPVSRRRMLGVDSATSPVRRLALDGSYKNEVVLSEAQQRRLEAANCAQYDGLEGKDLKFALLRNLVPERKCTTDGGPCDESCASGICTVPITDMVHYPASSAYRLPGMKANEIHHWDMGNKMCDGRDVCFDPDALTADDVEDGSLAQAQSSTGRGNLYFTCCEKLCYSGNCCGFNGKVQAQC